MTLAAAIRTLAARPLRRFTRCSKNRRRLGPAWLFSHGNEGRVNLSDGDLHLVSGLFLEKSA
jgi:hypothetical protein